MTAGRLKVCGMDLSLTSTGLSAAVWQDDQLQPITKRVQTQPPKVETLSTRSLRLHGITEQVLDFILGAHLAVLEAPSYGSTGGHAFDRAALWWHVVDGALELGIPLTIVQPTTLKKYVAGHGGSPKNPVTKDVMIAVASRRYLRFEIASGDVADSTGLAAMGARHLGRPLEDGPATKAALEAMKSPAWPFPAVPIETPDEEGTLPL